MRRISDTIARLNAGAVRAHAAHPERSGRLKRFEGFGSNPGGLRAYAYGPDDLAPGAPLVVVLHGCTQSAAGYDRASGWSDLADHERFALLYPEQQRANNANGCFNWFEAADTRRDHGEALSIRQMIAAMVERHKIDPSRVFVTGLSAGGAMAATMLATYPEVFAGGAIIAGLPHGVAHNMVQAFDRMRGHGLPGETELQTLLTSASKHDGPWPRVSIWHGGADATVNVSNAGALVAQWRGVHDLGHCSPQVNRVDGVPHRSWRGRDGQVVVEEYIVPGMAHGTPLRTKEHGGWGSPAPYMLDVGISSTARIAQFWEISGKDQQDASAARQGPATLTLPAKPEPRRLHGRRVDPGSSHPSFGVGKIIEDALRAAGLMK